MGLPGVVPIVFFIALQYYCKVLQYFGITTSQSIAINIAKSQSIAILIAKISSIAKVFQFFSSIAKVFQIFSSIVKSIAKSIAKKLWYSLLNFDW